MNKKYAITVITSTLNCESDLAKTCKSIKSQTYDDVQWIVIDGASVDGTLNVIQSNQDVITNWISEPDSGIYDAWNKACKLIQGQWVIFLGAGDELYAPNTFELIIGGLNELTDDVVIGYGNVYQILDGEVLYKYLQVDLKKWDDYRPSLPSHQGVFQRAALFDKSKPFDDSYKVVADSKFLLTALIGAKAKYFDIDICKMMPDGVSSSDNKVVLVKDEWLRLEKDLGYKIPFFKRVKYLLTVFLKNFLLKLIGPYAVIFLRNLKRKFLKILD